MGWNRKEDIKKIITMKRINTLILVSFLTFNYSCSQEDLSVKYSNSITEKELKDLLYVYASDEFEGRNTGEPGQKLAVEFIRDFYKANNIDKAANTDDYFQKFLVDFNGRNVLINLVVCLSGYIEIERQIRQYPADVITNVKRIRIGRPTVMSEVSFNNQCFSISKPTNISNGIWVSPQQKAALIDHSL